MIIKENYMSKFNLKNYKSVDGDIHIDKRLQESHSEAPDQISETQLEDYRASTEPDVLIEKLLDSKRLGGDDEITEKRLDDHKSKFANKYRNPKAYEGDINKLEEKRLKSDPVEKEEYKSASECPKQMRWWEDVKSPDGLKIAQDDKVVKTAQIESPEEVEMDMDEDSDIPDFDINQLPEKISDLAFEDETNETSSNISENDASKMEIIKWKNVPNVEKPEFSGIYVVLSYDPESFGGNEERIRQAALEKVIEADESLSGKIFAENFFDIKEEGGEGSIKLSAVGEEFIPQNVVPEIQETQSTGFIGEGTFSEVGYQEKDIDGTPMAIGRVVTTEEVTEENMAKMVQEALDFIRSNHPNLQINEESLDLIDLESKGEIGYVVGVIPQEEFPIKEASSKKK